MKKEMRWFYKYTERVTMMVRDGKNKVHKDLGPGGGDEDQGNDSDLGLFHTGGR